MSYEAILNRLKGDLNGNDIVWGVGGSFLLKLHELSSVVNDIDLWVRPCDMEKVRNIFRGYEEISSEISLPPELHFKMNYLGTEVDFVAAFIIKPNRCTFEYEISPNSIELRSYEDTGEIPLTCLEDWYFIYKLLKKNAKAERIEEFLLEHQFDIGRIRSEALSQRIPKYIKRDARRMIKRFAASLQLSLPLDK